MSRFNPSGYTTNDFIGEDGKHYKIVAGVIRNFEGSWALVDDSGHSHIHIDTIETDTNKIRINYDFTAKKVITFSVTPDEYFAMRQTYFGASVGLSYSDVTCNQGVVGGFVAYNGSTWDVASGNTGGITATNSGGLLTISHPPIAGTLVGLSRDNGSYQPIVDTLAVDKTYVRFLDDAGNYVSTPDTQMGLYFNRHGAGAVDPTLVGEGGAANIWIHGVFEI